MVDYKDAAPTVRKRRFAFSGAVGPRNASWTAPAERSGDGAFGRVERWRNKETVVRTKAVLDDSDLILDVFTGRQIRRNPDLPEKSMVLQVNGGN